MNSPLTRSENYFTGLDDAPPWDQIQPLFVDSDQLIAEQPLDNEPANSGPRPVGGELVHAEPHLKELPVKQESRNELVLRGVTLSRGNYVSKHRVLRPDRIPASPISISTLPIAERIAILGLVIVGIVSVVVLLVSYAESDSVMPSSALVAQHTGPLRLVTPPPSAEPAAASSPTPSVAVSSPAASAVVSSPIASALNELATGLKDDEISTLIKRGQALVKDGDFAAARVLFRRAADAGNAQAALALASTYDPTIIKQLSAVAVQPDIDRALTWYATAADRGSVDAAERYANLARARLELLASDAMIK